MAAPGVHMENEMVSVPKSEISEIRETMLQLQGSVALLTQALQSQVGRTAWPGRDIDSSLHDHSNAMSTRGCGFSWLEGESLSSLSPEDAAAVPTTDVPTLTRVIANDARI